MRPRAWFSLSAAVVLLAGCSSPAGEDSSGTSETVVTLDQTHVHSVDRPEPGGPILVGTHDGLWVQKDGELTQSGPVMDLMGFSAVDETTLRASGHPGENSDFLEPMGLIESTDGGQTWTPLSRQGESDFHLLETNSDLTVGFDGSLRWTTDGKEWQTSTTPEGLIDLTLNPVSPTLLATAQAGVIATADQGESWTTLSAAAKLVLIDWADDTKVVGIDEGGAIHVSRDRGATWDEESNLTGPVQAMAAGLTPQGQVEVIVVGETDIVIQEL